MGTRGQLRGGHIPSAESDFMVTYVDLAAPRTRLLELRNRIAAAAGIPLDGMWRPQRESE
ncbi:hypothetical protein ACWGI9_10805 [Streptomyces sp. NPDC054833]